MAYVGRTGRGGKRWRAEVSTSKGRITRVFDTRKQAEAWAAEIERKIRVKKAWGFTDQTLADVFERYLEDPAIERQRGSKWERIRVRFTLRDPIASTRLDELTPAVLAQWRDRRLSLVSSGTVRREMGLLSRILRIAAKEWGWLEHNPIANIEWPPDNAHRTRRVANGELAALSAVSGNTLQTRSGRVVAAFELAIETAMRGGEIIALRPANVFLERRIVHVPTSKNGDKRDVALTSRAIELLQDVVALRLDPVFGLNSASRDALFRKMVNRTGIEDLHFHDSRHEGITRLAQKLPILDLARQVGTRDLKTLMIYYNLSGEDRAKLL